MANDSLDDAGLLLRSASEAQSAGDIELAYDYYSRASEQSPNSAQAWRGRAATTPLADDALISCAYAVALTPNDQSLGQELDQRIRARAAAIGSNEAPALIAVGKKCAEVGLIREAHELLRRANELDDTLEDGFVWAAATTSDSNEASVALKRALALNPGDPIARAGFSSVMTELARAGAASPTQEEALGADLKPAALPTSAPDLIKAGEKALIAGDRTLAYQAFVRATELGPHEEGAWLGRARATVDVDETLTCLEQALAINPDNMQAREARTFYRVRKLRDGVRKRQEPEAETPRFTPTFAGGGGFSEQPTPAVRQRRILLLVIMIVILVFFLAAMLIRFGLI